MCVCVCVCVCARALGRKCSYMCVRALVFVDARQSLCVQDFEDIFMAGGMKTITDPDHNSFLK